MKLSEVTYTTEDPGRDYAKGLTGCDTLEKLRLFLAEWDGLVDDARTLTETMTEEDFQAFRKCLQKERSGTFSGMENIVTVGTLTMPELMFQATAAAFLYHVPWGLAVLRIKAGKDYRKL